MTYKIQKFFSIVFLLISFLSISAKAWEVNTHRAMDRGQGSRSKRSRVR